MIKLFFTAAGLLSLAVLGIADLATATTQHELRRPDGSLQAVWSEDRAGRLHGLRREYYPDGSLQSEIETNHGSWITMHFYWPSGHLKMKCESGVNGDSRVYYDDLAME